MNPINFLFLDIESAVPGNKPDPEKDRIVSLGLATATFYDGKAAYHSSMEFRFNPGMTMEQDNIDIHGITNEEAAKHDPFTDGDARTLIDMMRGQTLSGFNIRSYDIPLLWHEFARVGVDWEWRNYDIVDSYTLFSKREPRNLTAAVQFYLGDVHEGAHGAEKDALASANVLFEQLNYYKLAEKTAKELATETCHSEFLDISRKIKIGDDGRATYAFGKHVGVAVMDEQSYARWMIEKGTFSADTKRVLIDILTGSNR